MRVAIVFDVDDSGYRIGEFLDSDVQPVIVVYKDRAGELVVLNGWRDVTDEQVGDILEALP